MEPQGNQLFHRIWRVVRIPVVVIVILYLALVIYRIPAVMEQQKTEEVVAKIHAQRLTLKDVMGENLPPEPDPALKDATVEGLDANANGIRDDVELAIFKEYPNSAKTRAVLLQYAMALQIETVQPIINEGVVGEVANKQDRSIFCIAKIVPGGGEGSVIIAIERYGGFITHQQFNTEARKMAHRDFYKHLKSGRVDDSTPCDIELVSLLN